MKPTLLNEQQGMTELKVICAIAWVWQIWPAIWSHPHSVEPVTKSQKRATTWVITKSLKPQHRDSQTFWLCFIVHHVAML